MEPKLDIREAVQADFDFVVDLMTTALEPYYGGDHRAHAERIFSTHAAGGIDRVGHFSFEQKMFILTIDDVPCALLHLVGKRQGTYKISPLIVSEGNRGHRGLGSTLLRFAEDYAFQRKARQIYCTVAEQNTLALQFFTRNGYIPAGRSASHYKAGITEVMLYKLSPEPSLRDLFDRPNISVIPCDEAHEAQVRILLLDNLPKFFRGIDSSWVDALFDGYRRRSSGDINTKYKLIYVAVDRHESVLGVVGATPKKGEPIKLMPFIALTEPAFLALLTDIPYALRPFGRKLYTHLVPSARETIALQQRGWNLDAAMPAAYHDDQVTQQWTLDINRTDFMRHMRVKQRYLDHIKTGSKTLEVRVGYDNIKNIQPGERIRLSSHADAQIVIVKGVRRYSSFDEMLEHEDPAKIAPDAADNSEVLTLLREIYPERREKLGVVVLDIGAATQPLSTA